jgi:hypothetical protein
MQREEAVGLKFNSTINQLNSASIDDKETSAANREMEQFSRSHTYFSGTILTGKNGKKPARSCNCGGAVTHG